MKNSHWLSASPWFYGAILELDESSSNLVALNTHWLQALITAALFSAIVLALYLTGRFVPPPSSTLRSPEEFS
jgi:hypothetical protein